MKLTREAIQRMISQKPGTSNVTVINQGGGGGGGGVTLGPLLTSLNAVAMPSAEGYLHWTGSAWEFPSIDLSDMATKTWVGQNYLSSGGGRLTGDLYMGSGSPGSSPFIYWGDGGYVYIGEDSDDHMTIRGNKGVNILTGSGYNLSWNGDTIATETWVGQQGYLTSSAISDMATMTWVGQQGYLTSSAISDMATMTWVGQQGYLTSSAISDMATKTWVGQQGYLTSSAISDMATKTWVGQQGYLTSSAISDMATKTWVGQQGYITQATADGRYLPQTGGTLKGPLTFADSNGNSYGAIRAEKIGSDEYLYLWGNDGVLIDGLSVRKDNAIVPIEDVFLNLTGGTMEPGATITLQEIVNNIPVQTLVASQRWVNSQGFITSADLSGYATTNALTTGLAGKQNIIHFLNTKNNNEEVGFSYLHLPLSYSGAGHASLDLSDYLTALGVSGDNLTYTKNGAAANLTVPFATDSKALRNFFDSRPASANNQYGDGKLRHYMATSSMTTGKPPVDAHIIHSAWDDNTYGYDAQLAIGNSNTGLFFRTQSQGTWKAWKQVAIIDDLNTLGDNLQNYVTSQLGGYLPLTAGSSKPLTGQLYLDTGNTTEVYVNVKSNRVKANSGGWAFPLIAARNAADSVFFTMGLHGANSTLSYAYIGSGAYNAATNLRVYNDGSVSVGNSITIKGNNGVGLNIIDTNGTHDFTAFWSTQTINNVSREIFTMYSHETKYWDMSIGTHPNAVGYGGLYMYNSGNNVLRWGIGTATPSEKLSVAGNIESFATNVGTTITPTGIDVRIGGFAAALIEYAAGDANYAIARFGLRPQVKDGTDWLDVVIAKSDENGIEFRGSEDGTYTFGYGSGRGDIYAGAGDFTGAIEATSYNFRGTADAYGHGGASISHKSSSSVEGLEYYAGSRSGQHYFKAYNSSGNEVYANIHCLTCDETSDIRQKEVVEYLNPSVYDIANAPIIKFRWIGGCNDLHLGSISQYWEKTLPETVHIGDDLMQSMEKSTIALLAGITAARKAVDNERRIAELELRVAELEDELAAMVSQQRETTDN